MQSKLLGIKDESEGGKGLGLCRGIWYGKLQFWPTENQSLCSFWWLPRFTAKESVFVKICYTAYNRITYNFIKVLASIWWLASRIHYSATLSLVSTSLWVLTETINVKLLPISGENILFSFLVSNYIDSLHCRCQISRFSLPDS